MWLETLQEVFVEGEKSVWNLIYKIAVAATLGLLASIINVA